MANNIKVVLEIDNQQYITNINRAEQQTRQFASTATNEVNKVDNSLKTLNTNTGSLAATFGKLRGVLLGAAFIGMARSSLQLADAIDDLKNVSGLAAQDIINLRQAIQEGGGSAEGSSRAISSFYSKLDEAAQGSLQAQLAFDRVGISLDDLANLSERDILVKTVEGIKALPTPIEKAAAASDLLGRSLRGVTIDDRFLDTLTQGNEKSQELALAIERAAELNERWEKTWDNIRFAFLEAVSPILEVMQDMNITVPKLTEVFKVLGVVIATAFGFTIVGKFATAIGSVVGVVGRLWSSLRGVKGAVDGISTGARVATGTAAVGAVVAGTGAAMVLSGTGNPEARAQAESQAAARKAEQQAAAQASAARRVIDALNTQRDAVRGISNAYDQSTESAVKRIQSETKMITMSEAQKESLRSRIAVEEEAEKTIQRLQLERSKNSGKLATEIDIEIAKVRERRDATITALDEEIKRKEQALVLDRERLQNQEAIFDIQNKVKDVQDQYRLDTLVGIERQLASIEIAERKAAEAALQRWEINNRNLPNTEFEAGRAREAERLTAIMKTSTAAQQQAARAGYEASRTFSSGWNRAFKEYIDNATNAARAGEAIFKKFTGGIEDLLVNFVKTGKFEWEGFVEGMLETLLRSQIQQTMANIMQGMSGMSGGGGILGTLGGLLGGGGGVAEKGSSANNPLFVKDVAGGGGMFAPNDQYGYRSGRDPLGDLIGSLGGGQRASQPTSGGGLFSSIASGIGSLFGGFFANGGTLGAGKWGIAGENGPEIISGPATVTPMGGGSSNVTYNINAVDAASFKTLVAADPAFIHSVAMMGGSGIPSRR